MQEAMLFCTQRGIKPAQPPIYILIFVLSLYKFLQLLIILNKLKCSPVVSGTDHELWWHDHRQHTGLPYKVTSLRAYLLQAHTKWVISDAPLSSFPASTSIRVLLQEVLLL